MSKNDGMIPEAAVEAAWEQARDDSDGYPYPEREEIRRILEAAAPHIAAVAWEEGFMCSYDQERGGHGIGPIPVPERLTDDIVQWNPYRK